MPLQTILTDEDRAIISRLSLPALRNDSRKDDWEDFRLMSMCAAHAAAPHPYNWARYLSHHTYMACDPGQWAAYERFA